MLSIRRLVVLLGTSSLACVHAGKTGEGGASPGAVALRFAWPEDYRSHVFVVHESRRSGTEPTGLVARQRLVAERKGDEIWVSTHEIAARGTEPDLEAIVKINQALVQVVSPDGRFRRAEGLDQALSAMKIGSAAEGAVAREALTRSAASDWELVVGAWAGQTLDVDQVRHKQAKGGVPLLLSAETLLDVEYGLEGRVPCTAEDTARNCVQLSYRSRLAPEDRAATVERVRRLNPSKPNEAVPEDVHAELEALLITEPGTLVPHQLTQRERLRIRMRLPDGHVQEVEERSEEVSVFGERQPGAPEQENTPQGL
jgi:hypothetical protein